MNDREVRVSEIRRSLGLLHAPGAVFEIRALKMGRVKTASGYFDDFQAAAEAAYECDRRGAVGVYLTLNPCEDSLLARAANRMIDWPDNTTTDQEIVRRNWLFIDIDPIRPTGIGSSDEEKQAAQELAAAIEESLRARGWPYPLIADSGNGSYLLYRVDLPNDDDSTMLLKNFYAGLNTPPLECDHANIDKSVFNAARLIRIGGTNNRKGDDTPHRPHRQCVYHEPIDECPVTCVPVEMIQEVASLAETPTQPATPARPHRPPTSVANGMLNYRRLDVPSYLRARGIKSTVKSVDHGTAYLLPCPFDSNHGNSGESAVVQNESGLLTFECKHNSCAGRQWRDFRDAVGPPDRGHWQETSSGRRARLYGETELTEQSDQPPPNFTQLIDSRTLLEMDLRPRFLVRNVLVAGQPAVIGARSKGMKTSIATDLVVSLASGAPFLGEFETERCRVAFLSGESGAATIRDTAWRVAQAKGVEFADISAFWQFELPKLTRHDHLQAIADMITERSLDVLVLDPLYLSLLSVETANLANNLFAMGASLAPLSEIGQATGATIIVLHHFRKTGQNDPDEPAALENLAQSGTAEWARQWILLQRREPYQADGTHKLWMRCGGSTGHAGLYAVDIDEGVYDDANGRHWDVALHSAHDVRAEMRHEKENRKARDLEMRQKDDCRLMFDTVQQTPRETKNVLRQLSGLSNDRATRALQSLMKDGRIRTVDVKKHTKMEVGYEPTGK